ncbi:hypothetical protein [Kitasatospora paranensis]|uniref:hypothetical protein n=1 Tax=Kitasatospora paranensis TaxID=258053 RepID=UPI0031E61B7F
MNRSHLSGDPAALVLAESGGAADLAAFLARLLRFDRAAAVRLQAVRGPRGDGVLAVFGRLPLGTSGAIAIRTSRLGASAGTVVDAGPTDTDATGTDAVGTRAVGPRAIGADASEAGPTAPDFDVTVSAGQLLDGVEAESGLVAVPSPVTGPAWAGLLPPRRGWQLVGEPPAFEVVPELMAGVREFRERSEAVPEHHRTRAVLDALADEIWSRPLTALPELPLRAVHAAYVIGFLRPGAPLTVHRAGGWLRLSAPSGSVAVRRAAAPGAGLGLSPCAEAVPIGRRSRPPGSGSAGPELRRSDQPAVLIIEAAA